MTSVLNPVITAQIVAYGRRPGRSRPGLRAMPETAPARSRRPDDDGPVPLFGTWRAIYAAVAAVARSS